MWKATHLILPANLFICRQIDEEHINIKINTATSHGRQGDSNYLQLGWLFNSVFKLTTKLCIAALCEGIHGSLVVPHTQGPQCGKHFRVIMITGRFFPQRQCHLPMAFHIHSYSGSIRAALRKLIFFLILIGHLSGLRTKRPVMRSYDIYF